MRKQRAIAHLINSEINIIPLLDILLVLLIIFMIIPSKLIQNFEVNLPNSKISNKITNNNHKFFIIIEILGQGAYNLIIHEKHINQILLTQLISEINKHEHIEHHNNTEYLIAASQHTIYNEVIQVLNELNKMGIHSIGMITSSY